MKKLIELDRKCCVCGNNKGHFLWHVNELLSKNNPLPSEFDVVECEECGFSFANTIATEEDYELYYKCSNIYEGRSRKATPVADLVFADTVGEFFDKRDRILDMGCGDGTTLCRLHNMGYEFLCGKDLSRGNIQKLYKSGFCVDCKGVYDEVSVEEKESYDVIIMNCVLEHLLSPDQAIKNVGGYLRNSGLMVLMVPDMEQVEHGGIFPSIHFHHEHINYFSIVSLDNLMIINGFERVYHKKITEDSDMEATLLAVYRKQRISDGALIYTKLKKDIISPKAIIRFISKYNDTIFTYDDILEHLIKEKADVIVYGVGTRLRQMISSTKLKNINVIACIDGNFSRHGEDIQINGKLFKIRSIDDIPKDSKASFLVCVNAKQYEYEIISSIKQHGFDKIIVL